MQLLALRHARPAPRRFTSACVALCMCIVAPSALVAQLSDSTPPAGVPATAAERTLAPGVMVTIAPEIEPEETVSTHDVVEIRAAENLAWEPQFLANSRTLFGIAENAKFRRDVWCLEFSFKPVRMIDVSVPQADGTVAAERIWYMIYRVENTGAVVRPTERNDGSFEPQLAESDAVRFIPHLVLEGHDRNASGRRVYKAYLDQVIPAAVAAIRQRELPRGRLLNSAQLAQLELPPAEGRTSRGAWAVATWRDVDPRMDFFSVYVSGLTNAYRWADPPGAYAVGSPPGKGRRFARKTLQLNFWRPGDEYLEHEDEIRYGVPAGKAHLYDSAEGVASQWVYR